MKTVIVFPLSDIITSQSNTICFEMFQIKSKWTYSQFSLIGESNGNGDEHTDGGVQR